MHVMATNICVWIRTLVLEALKEITAYYTERAHKKEDNEFLENLRRHTLQHAGMTMGVELGPGKISRLNISSSYSLPSVFEFFLSTTRCRMGQ